MTQIESTESVERQESPTDNFPLPPDWDKMTFRNKCLFFINLIRFYFALNRAAKAVDKWLKDTGGAS
jgi:hypothetical protein